jgi:hypothetical protein
MKFTSLVITALVAATQFSSTLAAGSVEANDDTASTAASTAVGIAILTNDSLDNDATSPVQATKDNVAISDITLTTSPASGSAIPTGNLDGTITYTPVFGFSGNETFTYKIASSTDSTDTDTATVTVTVAAGIAVIDNFAFLQTNFTRPGQFDKTQVFGQVRGSLFDVASFTPGAGNNETLNAILGPVSTTDFNTFTGSTGFDIVRNSFAAVFTDFGNTFKNFFN